MVIEVRVAYRGVDRDDTFVPYGLIVDSPMGLFVLIDIHVQ